MKTKLQAVPTEPMAFSTLWIPILPAPFEQLGTYHAHRRAITLAGKLQGVLRILLT
jgi:hypothetical protein